MIEETLPYLLLLLRIYARLATLTRPFMAPIIQHGEETMKKTNHPHLDSQKLKQRLEEGILSELLPYRQWVVWRYQLSNNQWKKQPFNPANGRAAKTNDRCTWGTFSQALYRLETGKYHGIGFVFSDEDPFTGTDLDDAINEGGTIAEWAQKYIDALWTPTPSTAQAGRDSTF